jgi:O-antigen biosynthesis protein
MTNTPSSVQFQFLIKTDGWTIPQVADCLKQTTTAAQLDDEALCRTLLAWLEATPFVAKHATERRFSRLQFIENTLSAAGFSLTQRDFDGWFKAPSGGDWHPHDLLPYAPIDPRLAEQEARIDQLEHDLHQMEVARNRAKAELSHVEAQRDHFIAVNSEDIYKSVSADYQNSASWRVTKPLRRLMALKRGEKYVEPVLQPSTSLVPTVAPWKQPGYSVEKAWRAEASEDFDRKDYAEWVRRFDSPSAQDMASLAAQARELARRADAPSFSILMVVKQMVAGQPGLAWLQEAVASVVAQIYPKWELCIAVSTDTDAAARTALQAVASTEPRVKLVYAASNADHLLSKALSVATGDWVGELNAINLVAAKAINTLANDILEHENAQIIYSDADKLVAPGFERCQPDFKPDWNLDLYLSGSSLQNYIQDLCFFKMSLVRDLGGIDGSFELISRVIARSEPLQIHHIPQVLVHIRQVGRDAETVAHQKNQYLVRPLPAVPPLHAVPAMSPLVSLIIPTKNNVALLRQCIESILSKTSYANYEILVVDNGSDQAETLDYLKTLIANQKIRVIRDSYAFNYSALNNYAATFAKGEMLALVNDDIEVVSEHWLSEMVNHALRPGVGAVGARLWYPDHTLQHAGMVLVGGVARHIHKHLPKGDSGFNGRAELTQNFSAVTGACLVVKKALFEQVGGLNDQELAVGFNDVDLCLKLVEAGFRNVWTPFAELVHHESATRGQDDSPEKQRRAEKELRYMRKRWGDKLHIDPAYNPNLSDGHDDMSFAWPPR